jgi:hypothetical protein
VKFSFDLMFWKYDPPFWKSMPNERHIGRLVFAARGVTTDRTPLTLRASRLSRGKKDIIDYFVEESE